jgi:hypothetical protein
MNVDRRFLTSGDKIHGSIRLERKDCREEAQNAERSLPRILCLFVAEPTRGTAAL